MLDKLLPATTPKLDALGTLIAGFLGQPYQDEMKGVAKALNTSLGIIAIANLGYEVTAFCTSIVAQATDGSVYHARNLDFGEGMGFTDILRNMTFEVDFQSGGKTQYSCVTYASFVGCLTGVRPSGWAVTVNTRFPPDGEHKPLKQLWRELVEAITVKGSQVNSQLIRDTLGNTATFSDAKATLTSHPLIAQVYLTISGAAPGEGCVITRNMTGADDVWCLDVPNGRWYVLETNYDHWKPVIPSHSRLAPAPTRAAQVPWYDDRRTAAQAALNATGPDHANPDTLLAVLSTKPVLNLMTTYSIVAQPKTADVFNHYVRYCACDAAAASARALVVLRACSQCFRNQATTRAPIKQRVPSSPPLLLCVLRHALRFQSSEIVALCKWQQPVGNVCAGCRWRCCRRPTI